MNLELLKLAVLTLNECKYDERKANNRTLGTGCERIAYALNPGYIVKIAKHAFINMELDEDDWDDRYDYSEEWQTEKEIEIWKQMSPEEQSLFSPIVAHGKFDSFPFIVSPMIDIIGGIGNSAMDYCKKNEIEFDFDLLRSVAEKFDLDFYDMTENSNNFGITREGKLVITDFGLLN